MITVVLCLFATAAGSARSPTSNAEDPLKEVKDALNSDNKMPFYEQVKALVKWTNEIFTERKEFNNQDSFQHRDADLYKIVKIAKVIYEEVQKEENCESTLEVLKGLGKAISQAIDYPYPPGPMNFFDEL